MESLGMNALLAVGRGSTNPPKLAVLEWKNGLDKKKPLVLLGKGVVLDSGGISM